MAAPKYSVQMKHTEESLVSLSHMQYDQFCQRNFVARSILSLVCILLGLSQSGQWWAYLLIAYGCYLLTTKYMSANRTAGKIANGLKDSKLPFPASRYDFYPDHFEILDLNAEHSDPSRVSYDSLIRLGEDFKYYYMFPTRYGGYMLPKEVLGDNAREFKVFLQNKTGKKFARKSTPFARFTDSLRARNNEPYHL